MNREQTRKSERGTRNRADRLRALNVQQRVEVTLDERGVPVVVKREAGSGRRIESIGEMWRIDDEWWRTPNVRRNVGGILEGGGRGGVFEDPSPGGWGGKKRGLRFRVPR